MEILIGRMLGSNVGWCELFPLLHVRFEVIANFRWQRRNFEEIQEVNGPN